MNLAELNAIANRMTSGNNLKQMTLALHMYADGHGGRLMQVSTYVYPANGSVTYPQAYWFGTMTADGQIDLTKGFLMPYMEGQRASEQCPDFGPGQFQLRFQGATSGYGYNYQYLGAGPSYPTGVITWVRLVNVTSTSRTESALFWLRARLISRLPVASVCPTIRKLNGSNVGWLSASAMRPSVR